MPRFLVGGRQADLFKQYSQHAVPGEARRHARRCRAQQPSPFGLLAHFLEKYGAALEKQGVHCPAAVMQALMAYGWPGNIRELENVIERAVILARGAEITAANLPIWKREPAAELPADNDRPVSLENVERDHIRRTLAKTGYHKSKTAEILGISRKTLDRKIVEYGLKMPEV